MIRGLFAAACLTAAAIHADDSPRAILQCVEFRYAAFPRQFWERELVWMKNVGIHSVALTVPRDWDPADQRPSRDLLALLRILRRLDLTAWVQAERETPELNDLVAPQMQAHGGPIAWWGANAAPQPVTRLSALSPTSLASSREALAKTCGTLLWTDVEDTLSPVFHHGAISFSGEEQNTLASLRREALLVGYWGPSIPRLNTSREVQPVIGRLPAGVVARQMYAGDAAGESAVSIINRSKVRFHGELRAYFPPAKRTIQLPAVDVPAQDSLWLPVNIPLANGPFCKRCDALGHDESVVYATAELINAEYENGILALEFAAPADAQVVVHLSQEPSGPLVAGGKPREFDWDTSTNRARLPIPAGTGPGNRVRIALALEPPDHSAFFGDDKVLVIGQTNTVHTTYSSEDVAKRSRVRAPASLKIEAVPKSPLEIDYRVSAPPDAYHGDHVELALEADGEQMGHVRMQLLRAASLRIREALNRHFGSAAELPVTPALVAVDQRAGRSISITIRNNVPEIRNYVLELSGDGVEFTPARTEISIAASSERDVSVRVFADQASPGLHAAKMRLSGGASLETPVQFAVIPRGASIAYSADLDGDGQPEYVLETQKARAVFSNAQAERWLEFDWKDSERNVLPEVGIALGAAQHTVTLHDAQLTIRQDAPLPAETLKPGKQGEVVLQIQRTSPSHAVYTLSK